MRTRSQRLLSMVLALSMLLTFLPVSAFAEGTPPPYVDPQPLIDDDDDNNTYTDRDNNRYVYALNSDGTATLTNFTGKHANVPKTVEKDDTPYTVTAIGDSAFANHDNSSPLESVNLPHSIQTIGHAAFFGCSLLSKITLLEGLTTIGNAAFAGTGLTDVTLPKSLKNVGQSAFVVLPYGSNIKTVTYTGTKEEWDKLVNSTEFDKYNTQLTNVTPHCAYTVTFNVNGHGTAPEAKEVQYGKTVKAPDRPTADGYTFKGWYTAAEGGEPFDFTAEITEDKTAYAQWEEKKPDTDKPTTPEQPPESTDKPTDKPNEPNPPQNPDNDKPGTQEKPNEPTPPEAPAVEEDDTAAIGYAAAAVTAAFVGWGAYRIGSEVYLKYLLPKDVLLPQNRLQLAELLWEDAGRPAPADAAPYADVDANDTDARQAARWAVENGLLTLPDAEKPEEFAPYRSVSYAKSARAWNKAQQLKENAAR